ncbi:MAG: hypothetical protein ACRC2H_07950 [Silanimonas sp.]
MSRTAFVGTLYVMALACLVIAITDGAFGWLLGAAVVGVIAEIARRQAVREHVEGRAGMRGWLVGGLMLFMVAAIYGIYLLDTSA